MDAAIDIWAAAHVTNNLRVESFREPSLGGLGSGETLGMVNFSTSGVSAKACGSTILDTAEAAGLSPKSGCRMGICHSCVTRVVSGNAIDLRDGSIRSAGDTVQICVSCPVDEVTVDL
jgi:ferredoxin